MARLNALREQRGRASGELTLHMQPGAVFVAEDRAVQLPGNNRTWHYDRWVIVASPAIECANDEVPTVYVVPCSSKLDGADPRDMLIAATEPGFVVASVALLRFAQRVPKGALKDCRGVITGPTLAVLIARLGLAG